MTCPACGHDNPDGAGFCNACGAALNTLHPDRRTALRAYIPAEVAHKILTAGGTKDRRIVTVLFCDVVGSTPIAERLGPERSKVVMDQVLGRMITAISNYEGIVTQLRGDGLLAFFGAPLAHEDDPERAVRAALDIRDALAVYSRELETAYGMPLQVRIGLNTGPVVISSVTDVLEVAYNALGDTINTAARLESMASSGTILASGTTARLIAPVADVRPIGPLTLKGKAAPVPAVEVLGLRAVTGKPRGIPGLVSPLVGRERELGLLLDSVHAVNEGRGQIVAVIGEAGIGKSRLLVEAHRGAAPIRWLEGRCLSYAGGIPYFPLVDLVREWLGVTPGDPAMKVRIELRAAVDRLFGSRTDEVYPYLASMLHLPLEADAAARIADLSAESLQHQTFKVLREWAARLASERPLALVLDDLHWADPTSLAVAEALLEVTEEAPLLLALLFRPERDHDCWRMNDLARRTMPHRHVEIVLEPLPGAATEQLVSNLLVISDLPDEVRSLILAKAEGNPFFVEEVIRILIETGMLAREDDRWHVTGPVTALDVPNSIQGVLLSRIDRLSEDAKRVLQAAAVIGRLFSLEILKAAFSNGRIDAALTNLQRMELVVERRRIPQPEYRFKHALTQEVAYGTLSDSERRLLHRQVAQALEAHHADRPEEVYGLLAYHYDRAADEERALHFLVRAGDKARAEYADQEALRHYTRAVELLKQRGEWEAAAQTLMKAALAHHIAFDLRSANDANQEVFQMVDRIAPSIPVSPTATLRLVVSEPMSLDMARATDPSAAILARELFEGLLLTAPEGSVANGTARSWQISPDGDRYIFSLHRDRKWSDGKPVTAHDFVFAWLRGMRGLYSHIFHDIKGARDYSEGKTDDPRSIGVRALDDYALEVVLEGPRAYFPFILAGAATVPQARWALEQFGDDWTAPGHLVGNGPFILAEWEGGSHARLVANHAYTGRRRGNVTEVHVSFKASDDPTVFEQAKADVQPRILLDEDRARRLHRFLHIEPPSMSWYLAFCCDQPPFDDRRLRFAFAHATDRQALAKGRPYLAPGEGGLIAPAISGHSPYMEVPFDPERARDMLKEAGYPAGRGLGPFVLTVPQELPLGPTVPTSAWLEILGIQVTVETRPIREWIKITFASHSPLKFVGWGPGPDPVIFLKFQFQSTSPWNLARWKNPRFDALVTEAGASTDHRRRMALCHEADRLLVVEEAAIVPLGYSRNMTLVQPYVKGWWTSYWPCRIADLTVEREDGL